MPCHDSTTESISCKQGCHVGVCKLQSAREAKKKSRQIQREQRQQRLYRASKVSCWGLEQTRARRNTVQQFQPYPLQYSADSAILCKYSAILCNNTVQQSANTVQTVHVGGWVWHFLYRRGAACPSCPEYGLHTIPMAYHTIVQNPYHTIVWTPCHIPMLC